METKRQFFIEFIHSLWERGHLALLGELEPGGGFLRRDVRRSHRVGQVFKAGAIHSLWQELWQLKGSEAVDRIEAVGLSLYSCCIVRTGTLANSLVLKAGEEQETERVGHVNRQRQRKRGEREEQEEEDEEDEEEDEEDEKDEDEEEERR